MTRNHKQVIKALALLLAFIFTLSEISYAAPLEAASFVQTPLQIISQDPTRFEAPVAFTTLREVHKGDKPTFIIHIQDAHANLSGQQNLAAALDDIMTKYHVTLVLVEGGTKDDTLTPIKKIAPPDVWKKVAKKFLYEGKISGEEYLNLISDHPMKIMGIEDKPLYMESLKAYGDLAEKRGAILDYLKTIELGLDKLKRRLYPKELLEYEILNEIGCGQLRPSSIEGLKDFLSVGEFVRWFWYFIEDYFSSDVMHVIKHFVCVHQFFFGLDAEVVSYALQILSVKPRAHR